MQSQLELILSNAPRVEKLKFWMRNRTPSLTFRDLAKPLNVTSAALGRNCAQETIPVEQHQSLVAFGVPLDLLPAPLDRKRGPKPKRSE